MQHHLRQSFLRLSPRRTIKDNSRFLFQAVNLPHAPPAAPRPPGPTSSDSRPARGLTVNPKARKPWRNAPNRRKDAINRSASAVRLRRFSPLSRTAAINTARSRRGQQLFILQLAVLQLKISREQFLKTNRSCTRKRPPHSSTDRNGHFRQFREAARWFFFPVL